MRVARAQYKFVVDGEWRHAPDQAAMFDEVNNVNNVLEVQEYTPENLDSLSGFDPPPSPPSRSPSPSPRGRGPVSARRPTLPFSAPSSLFPDSPVSRLSHPDAILEWWKQGQACRARWRSQALSLVSVYLSCKGQTSSFSRSKLPCLANLQIAIATVPMLPRHSASCNQLKVGLAAASQQ